MRHICTSIVAMLALAGTSFAATINVPADYTTIQAAVDAASGGDVILVAPGTYTGTGDQVVDMLGKAITLRASGTPEQTIIDGEGARRVLQCSTNEGAGTIIEGFTITGGYAESGVGIYCFYSSPTITNCTISGNLAYYGGYGGGISCYNSNLTISGCTISDNTAFDGGGIYCEESSPTISGCTISGNYAFSGGGGGIYCSDSSPTVSGCTITDNYSGQYGGGGGICTSNGSSPTITDCTISDNRGNTGGGIYCWDSSPTITGCTISGNTAIGMGANLGGGISCNGSISPTITGCTISGNTADGGGGIYCYESSPTLTDTVVCGNAPDQIDGNWTDNGGNTVAEVCPPDCPDVSGDGFVGVDDLLAVVAAWGSDDPFADVDGDGVVGTDDLLTVIANWGPCP